MTIKVVCAWCGRTMKDGEPGPNGEVSHGICEKCRRELENEPPPRDPFETAAACVSGYFKA